jgi:hypothetical protein
VSTLGDIAHARAGDKGDTSILVVVPFVDADFALIEAALVPDRVAAHFGVEPPAITVHSAPGLGAFTIVVRGRLDGGVTRSRSADPHGKTLSGHLLDFPLAAERP